MSGYNYDFVNKVPDRLLCQICKRPCRDPHRSVCCGHVFCKSELHTSSEQLGEERCPQCLKKEFIKYIDRSLQRDINEISIYCPNKKDGCGWIGEIAHIDNHMKKCEISCSKCKQIIYFSTMRTHLDTECPCYCPYCDITAEREVISSKHKEKCSKFPITCPNNCGLDDIPRDDMDDHKKVCPLEMIQCEYHQCGAVIARNEIMEHYRLNFLTHIHSFKSELDSSFQTMTALLSCCTEAERNVAYLLSSVSNALDDMDVKFKPVNHVDALTPPHAKLQPNVSRKSFNDVSEPYQKCLMPRFLQYCIMWIVLLNSLLVILLSMQIFHLAMGYNKSKFIYPILTEMDERLSLTLYYLILGCGFIKRPPPSDQEYELEYWKNTLGIQIIAPVILEMPHFDKYRINNEQWYSSPFFALEGGYLVCLRVDAAGNGDGEGAHVSVYLHLMKGPHDDKLKWPMRGRYEINLIHPTNSSLNTCNPYFKNVHFNENFADYNRVTASKMSYYGLGYAKYIDSSNAILTNLTIATSFLTKHNSLLFEISYYDVYV